MDPAYLLNDRNILGPPANDRQEVKISLPENVDDLSDALFPLHRALLDSYRGLPWPRKMQKIVALTEVRGGRGDIAAAGKALGLMQKICPDLRFDWVLRGAKLEQYNPQAFLLCDDPSKISMRRWESDPTDGAAADFMLAGPVKLTSGVDYIASKIHRKIAGPTCAFAEIGEECSDLDTEIAQELVRKANEEKQPLETIYAQNKLHKRLFPSRSSNGRGLFPMGLQPGSGVFLEPSRIAAPLSRGYCCPSYLPQIEDAALRKDILEAMGVYDGASEPDYDQYSLNSGYAHRPVSWGKFIDFTAIHERNKHVAVVLNQHGEYDRLSTEEFAEQIFTPERLAYLKAQGYGTIILKGEEEQAFSLGQSENPEQERRLVVIVRKKFLPQDMRRLQLASERLLGTGDNSALEAWCARCKLYLYEDVANGGCKWRFLQQQVDLAKQFSPNLSRLLALFGGDSAANIGLSLPCAYWPVPPVTPVPTAVSAPEAPPIVVVGTTGDPATPVAWAENLARQLGTARLITVDGTTHTSSLDANPCLDRALRRYLLRLQAPKPGLRCPA